MAKVYQSIEPRLAQWMEQDSWAGCQVPGELDDYRARRYAVSLDGLPGLW